MSNQLSQLVDGVDVASSSVGLARSANAPIDDQTSTPVELVQWANAPLADQASMSDELVSSANTAFVVRASRQYNRFSLHKPSIATTGKPIAYKINEGKHFS